MQTVVVKFTMPLVIARSPTYYSGVKKLRTISTLVSTLTVLCIGAQPLLAHASTVDVQLPPTLPPIIITEIQPGTEASASEEFIELQNTTDQVIDLDLHEWHLEIASTTATSWATPFRSVLLSGQIGPGQTYIIASQYTNSGAQVRYLETQAHSWLSAGIAATGGHVRLVYATNQPQDDDTCAPSLSVVDELEWSVPKNGLPSVPSLDGRAVFLTATTSGVPKATSLQRLYGHSPDDTEYIDTDNDATDFAAVTPTPAAPSIVQSAVSPAISGVLPVGLPADGCSVEPPVLEPGVESPEDPGGDSPVVTDPNQGLAAVQLSEVFPNPAPPQTDENDEYVELYNPNDAAFDVSGFVVRTGLTTEREYVIPTGTRIAPRAFLAFTSEVTGLNLANSGSHVVLISPDGDVVTETTYGTAKEGQAWTFANAVWQWTTTPTAGSDNTLTLPVPVVKTAVQQKAAAMAKVKTATSKKQAATKKSAAKVAKQKKEKKAIVPAATVLQSNRSPAEMPIHGSVLAVAALFALLYGAYEYRGDLANKLHKLRTNRAARRASRSDAEGR